MIPQNAVEPAAEEAQQRQREFEEREHRRQQRAGQRRQLHDLADNLNFGCAEIRVERRRRSYGR
jgi:hypothetical protein